MKTSSVVILLLGILITLGSISWIAFLAFIAPTLVPSYGGGERIVMQQDEESLVLSLRYPLVGMMRADRPVKLYANDKLLGEGTVVSFELDSGTQAIMVEGSRGTSVRFAWSQRIPLSEYGAPTAMLLIGVGVLGYALLIFVGGKKIEAKTSH